MSFLIPAFVADKINLKSDSGVIYSKYSILFVKFLLRKYMAYAQLTVLSNIS